jgi:nucleotide-binding universal stress UspA family protein
MPFLMRPIAASVRPASKAVRSMDKITSILAIVENSASGMVVLDKAVALARAFGARVDLLVADSLLTHEFASRCAARVYDEVTLCSLFRSGEPLHALVLRRILERSPDLVIKAPAGAHPLRTWTSHANDRELAAQCPVPLMLAGMNPWAMPMRIAAAVDVSDPETTSIARSILQAAGFLTLGCQGTLDILYSEREQRDETLRMERAVRLAQLVREFHVGSERLQMFDGKPDERLPPLIAARQYDLLVIGALTHREGISLALDTLSGKLADATTGDVVLVKRGENARQATHSRQASVREKVANQGEQFV